MKKFIIKLALFASLVIVLDVTFGLVCSYMFQHAKGGDTKSLNYLIQDCDKDILVMGSSRAHCHYDDQMIEDSLGISCYNTGVEGNGIIMMYGLDKLMAHKPRIILYDIEPSFDIYEYSDDQKNTRYISTLKFYNNGEVRDIVRQIDPSLVYKNLCNFYRYNTKFITVAKDFFLASPIKPYGFEPAFGEMVKEPESTEKNELKIDSQKYHFFERLIDETNRDGVHLIVIASPKYGYDGASLEPIKQLCAQKGVPFFDYSNEECFQQLCLFKEPMHLNKTGATLFTRLVISKIKGNEFY